MRARRTVLAAALALLAGSAAAAQQVPPAPPAGPATVSEAATADVVLRAGDVLKVTIWREEDLTGEFLVDEAGAVTLPLLGRRVVAGRPMREVRQELMAAYSQQLRNPAIEIVPLRRINLLGEVQKPGLYMVDPTVSLAGAVATAGGTTPAGDLNRIRIIREGRVYAARVAYTRTLENVDIRSGDQILVDRRGWFDRNSTFVVSTLLSVTSIIIALAR